MTTSPIPSNSVDVVCLGARDYYHLPKALADLGFLKTLYTDFAITNPATYSHIFAFPFLRNTSVLKKLQARRVPHPIAQDQVTDISREVIFNQIIRSPLARLFRMPVPSSTQLLQMRLAKESFSDVSAIVSFVGDDFEELFSEVKRNGTILIHNQSGLPGRDKIINDERLRYRHLEPPWPDTLIDEHLDRSRKYYGIFDGFLAASPIVKRNLTQYIGIDPEKIEIVPYGVPVTRTAVSARPERGTVLCVARVDIGKGVQYLAEASRILRDRGRNYDFKVIGSVPKTFLDDPAFRGPLYLGELSSSDVAGHMRNADVFVFPALADAFGLVQIEAMRFGVPVIATDMCGDVVRNGIDGLVTPARNASSLASSIEEIVENRDLRESMSGKAFSRAREYSYEAYLARLSKVLDKMFVTTEAPRLNR